jgi:flagellar basal body-associated protein FliL
VSNELRDDSRESENGIFILVLVILLLLGAVGGGAYWFLGQRQQAAARMEMQAMEAERAAEAARHAAEVKDKSKLP